MTISVFKCEFIQDCANKSQILMELCKSLTYIPQMGEFYSMWTILNLLETFVTILLNVYLLKQNWSLFIAILSPEKKLSMETLKATIQTTAIVQKKILDINFINKKA